MRHRFRSGVILTELVITTAISLVLVSAIGVLLISGNRTWQQTYDSAHKQIKQDAQAVTVTFGSMGRKSNRLGYIIYNININGNTFTPAVPTTSNPEEVVSGDAVEFRYWDVKLDETDSHDLIDVQKTATAYALFYLEGNQLKVDYGRIRRVPCRAVTAAKTPLQPRRFLQKMLAPTRVLVLLAIQP